jgi:hypothetical protein
MQAAALAYLQRFPVTILQHWKPCQETSRRALRCLEGSWARKKARRRTSKKRLSVCPFVWPFVPLVLVKAMQEPPSVFAFSDLLLDYL